MPNFFSGMGGFGRGMVSAGNAAGIGYRGWQDFQQKQLDRQIAQQRMQLDQQNYELNKKREGLEENEFGLKMWEQQQALVQDAMDRQSLSELLSTLAKIPGTDPAKAANYKAGAMALANGGDWGHVSQAMGLDGKALLEAAKILNLTAGAGEKKTKSAQEAATTKLLNEAGVDTGDGDGTTAPAAAAPPAAGKTKATATPFGDTAIVGELRGNPAGNYYDKATNTTYIWNGTAITGRSTGRVPESVGGTP